ncbi:outer membrane usher protein, partial [Acinetobacter nosocomialis 28F]
MKYIIGVLCVAYFPAHSFAEQLVDHTNTLIPSVPESIDGNNKYTQEKINGQEQNLNFIQLFLNISINSNPSEDLFSVKQSALLHKHSKAEFSPIHSNLRHN